MADETDDPIWFVAAVQAVIHTLLHDKDRTMGWLVVALGSVSMFLVTGGVIPTTSLVIPLPPQWAAWYPRIGTAGLLWAAKLATGSRSKLTPEERAFIAQLRAEAEAKKP